MKPNVAAKLSAMMFLEFFIWGGWFVTLGSFLGNNLQASDSQIAMAYSTQSWGAIIAPFIIGLIADRYFNAEKILAFLHFIGALLMLGMARSADFSTFYPFVLGYMILYMPTLALVNSVAFNQMSQPSKQFPLIRVFGTLGWIIAGLFISFAFRWDAMTSISQGLLKNTFIMTAVASGMLTVLSLFLPKTPPKNKGEQNVSIASLFGFDALQLLKDRNYLLFFISSILICIPLAFYYQNISPFLTELEISNSTAWTTVGQMSELLLLLLLPVFFTRFGFKKTILVGMFAWFLRYICFSYGNAGNLFYLIFMGIALHGICYDFFFVSGQIYTDSKAGPKIKSAAQGLITLATYGFGMLIGFAVAGQITNKFALAEGGHDWQNVWIYPAGFAAAVFIFFALFFKNETVEYSEV